MWRLREIGPPVSLSFFIEPGLFPVTERHDSRRPPPTEEPAPESGDERDTGRPREIGGRKGLEPTRYGDWEKNGRCIDF